MLKDITTKEDIENLVNLFYDKVKCSTIIGHIFSDVAKVDWDHHLPVMYSFWGSILLGEHSYAGNPMSKHIALSKLTSLTDTEFSEWLQLFNKTVNENFEGPKAEEAKIRAANIARLMLHKINTASTGISIQ